jgi:hypothetical protein
MVTQISQINILQIAQIKNKCLTPYLSREMRSIFHWDALRLTLHASRTTPYALRYTPYSLRPTLHASRFTPYALRFMLFLAFSFFVLSSSPLYSFEIPLDIHGRGFLGKYLNSDTIRYNMDASIDVYCTLLMHHGASFFVRYRDDLDMAEQRGGVTLDPRYSHYYIFSGIDYVIKDFLFSGYFIHDCVHDIDFDVEGTPVFNRFRFQIAASDFHFSQRLRTTKKFLWSLDIGLYPHWYYHGFDINAGADYKFDIVVDMIYNILRSQNFGIDIFPTFQVAKGDTCFYHQHTARLKSYYTINNKHFGLGLDYNIVNNDPIKSPENLWMLSIFVEF